MKKYYGLLYIKGIPYVIRFRIKGSLAYDEYYRAFIDKDWYVRSVEDIIFLAAFDTNAMNMNRDHYRAFLISKEEFIRYRIEGIQRWEPMRAVIDWP